MQTPANISLLLNSVEYKPLPVSVMSQSVSNSRASGWTAEESLMKTFPLDLTALKKVNQRLGNCSFPLRHKRRQYVYTHTMKVNICCSCNFGARSNLFTEERWSSTGPLKVRKDTRLGRKRPPLLTIPFFTWEKKKSKEWVVFFKSMLCWKVYFDPGRIHLTILASNFDGSQREIKLYKSRTTRVCCCHVPEWGWDTVQLAVQLLAAPPGCCAHYRERCRADTRWHEAPARLRAGSSWTERWDLDKRWHKNRIVLWKMTKQKGKKRWFKMYRNV